MAKAATRTTKPAGKPATTGRTSPPAQSGGSKAQQAARHQGRDPEPARPPKAGARDSQPHTDRLDKSVGGRDVATRPGSGAPPAEFGTMTSVPAFMRGDVQAGNTGKDAIGNEDIEIPRLKLIQGLSPELNNYNELKAGHFFHTSSEFIFDEAFRAVPIYLDCQYILWRPRDAGGGILARASDGIHWSPSKGDFTVQLDKNQGGGTVTWKLAPTVAQSGLANWGTMDPDDPNSPPAATKMYNVVLAFPDYPDLMPAAVTFQRSSIKMGRRFNTKLKTTRIPIFGLMFEFSSFVDSNSRGQDFHNISAKGAGHVEDEGLYNLYKTMHEGFRKTGLSLKDVETLQGEDEGSNDTDEGEDGGESERPKF